MPLARDTARIVGYGMTRLGKHGRTANALMQEAFEAALGSAGLRLRDIDGLVAVPSLSHPHFMEAHMLATRVGLLPHSGVRVRTIDTGGAGPVSGLLEAVRMVKTERCQAVAVVAGDAVSSLDTAEFLQRADATCTDGSLASPVIPSGYDRIAQWQIQNGHVTREQLAMVSVLMSRQAARHPAALTRRSHTLEEVLSAPSVAPVTGRLECARRADGGAAIIVASSNFMDARLGHDRMSSIDGTPSAALGPAAAGGGVVVLGGGEASGPLYPPAVIDGTMFSCEAAAKAAFSEAQLLPADIDWFGLYDCCAQWARSLSLHAPPSPLPASCPCSHPLLGVVRAPLLRSPDLLRARRRGVRPRASRWRWRVGRSHVCPNAERRLPARSLPGEHTWRLAGLWCAVGGTGHVQYHRGVRAARRTCRHAPGRWLPPCARLRQWRHLLAQRRRRAGGPCRLKI